MASYQPTILPHRPTVLEKFSAGVGQGMGSMGNIYAQAAIQDKLRKKQQSDQQSRYDIFANDPRYQSMDQEINVGPDGTNYKFKTPNGFGGENMGRAVKEALVGLRDPASLGPTLGIPQDQPMMSMAGGGQGDIHEQPTQPYSEKVLSALSGLDTGFTKQQMLRDAMGLPVQTPSEIQDQRQPQAPSESELFNSAAKQAVKGEIPWQNLTEQFPTKYKDVAGMKEALSPPVKSPGFVEGTGSPISNVKSFLSGNQAELSDETRTVIKNIKSKDDLDELIQNAAEYEEAGVDIKAIKEYFGKK